MSNEIRCDVKQSLAPRILQEQEEVYRFSRPDTNFPDVKHAEADINDVFQQLLAEYEDLRLEVGPDVKLVCDFSGNDMHIEHLIQFKSLLLSSPVSLYALDLSWNRYAPSWGNILPIVCQLLTKATYVDLAGNYLPALAQDSYSRELAEMLTENASFATPNVFLGDTPWMRKWTLKAHQFWRNLSIAVVVACVITIVLVLPFSRHKCLAGKRRRMIWTRTSITGECTAHLYATTVTVYKLHMAAVMLLGCM